MHQSSYLPKEKVKKNELSKFENLKANNSYTSSEGPVSLSPNKPQSEKILEMQSAPCTNDSLFSTSKSQISWFTQKKGGKQK